LFSHSRFRVSVRINTPITPALCSLQKFFSRPDRFKKSPANLLVLSRPSKHSISNRLRFSSRRVLCAGRSIVFGLRPFARRLASTADRIEFTCLSVSRRVTDCSFTSSCSPPGGVAPTQLLSVTGPSVSARSGTFTPTVQVRSQARERGHPTAAPPEVDRLTKPCPALPRSRVVTVATLHTGVPK